MLLYFILKVRHIYAGKLQKDKIISDTVEEEILNKNNKSKHNQLIT